MITEKSASFIMYADKMVALQATLKKKHGAPQKHRFFIFSYIRYILWYRYNEITPCVYEQPVSAKKCHFVKYPEKYERIKQNRLQDR